MRINFVGFVATALAALLTLAHGYAQNSGSSAPKPAARTAAPAKKTPPVPRTADGKPDLNGVWQPGSDRVGTWEEANQGVGVPEPGSRSRVTFGGPPPYQPWAAALVQKRRVEQGLDPNVHCMPRDAPRIWTDDFSNMYSILK